MTPARLGRGRDKTICRGFRIQVQGAKSANSNRADLPRVDKWLEELNCSSQCLFRHGCHKTNFVNHLTRAAGNHANKLGATSFDSAIKFFCGHKPILPLVSWWGDDEHGFQNRIQAPDTKL